MILFVKHAQTEGPGILGDFFKETSWQIRTVELWNKEILPKVNDCEAIISLGGPMNVYETEKYPFLEKEEDFLKTALDKKIPVLGICLGAQLLAKVCQAKVTKAANKEIGWYKVQLKDNSRVSDGLFAGMPSELDVFQWHEDTFSIPDKGTLLATSVTCENQAMRVYDNAWGLQFHPEMTDNMIDVWCKGYSKSQRDEMLLTYFQKKDVYVKQARLLCLNFSKAITG